MQALISNPIKSGSNSKLRLLLIVLLPFFGLSNCGKEKIAEKAYPRVTTVSSDRISNSTVTFSGEIISGDLSQITEYGFVWSRISPSPYLENSEKTTITGAPTGKRFSETQDLATGQSFYFRAYAKTADFTVYGNVLGY